MVKSHGFRYKKSQNQSISHWIAFEVADGKAMTSDHVLCWSSSVKPLMSIALGQLQDRKKQGKVKVMDVSVIV